MKERLLLSRPVPRLLSRPVLLAPALALTLVLALALALTGGCSRAAAPTAGGAPPAGGTPVQADGRTGGTPMVPDPVNPHITPPPLVVEVDPNLVVIPAPDGWLSQGDIRLRAIAAVVARSDLFGTLTLTSIQPDEANKLWVVAFATDGRQVSGPHSHPASVGGPRDPVEQRKAMTSDSGILSAITYAFDAQTGAPRGGGFEASAPNLSRRDLEHYVGRIIEGGASLRLRLTNPDGSRDGRDLEVWVPQEALGSGLALWQIMYGAGRQLEVWGLTSGPGKVTAYRLAMADPPPEDLLQYGLAGNMPVYPGAAFGPDDQGWISFTIGNARLAQVWDWYSTQMPRYGYHPPATPRGGPPTGGALGRRTFRNDAWEEVTIEATPVPEGIHVRINRTAL